MSEARAQSLFSIVRQSADAEAVAAIEALVRNAPDHELCRINALAFATKRGLNEERVIAAFLHAARARHFRAVVERAVPRLRRRARRRLPRSRRAQGRIYAARSAPPATSRRSTRWSRSPSPSARACARSPRTIPTRCRCWNISARSSGAPASICPTNLRAADRRVHARCARAAARREGVSVAAAAGRVRDRVRAGHARGAVPRRQGRADARAADPVDALTTRSARRPGPSRCGPGRCASSLENRTDVRVLPASGSRATMLHDLLGKRRPFLTAKRLLTNQTFRDIYRTDTLDVDQRLKITSLTFLFTDLKGSTELYERVGDLVAYRSGARAFPRAPRDRRRRGGRRGEDHRRRGDGDVPDARPRASPRRCACARRCAASTTTAATRGPAAQDRHPRGAVPRGHAQRPARIISARPSTSPPRVQGLAMSRSIFATGTVVEHPDLAKLLATERADAGPRSALLARHRRRDDGLRNSLSI